MIAEARQVIHTQVDAITRSLDYAANDIRSGVGRAVRNFRQVDWGKTVGDVVSAGAKLVPAAVPIFVGGELALNNSPLPVALATQPADKTLVMLPIGDQNEKRELPNPNAANSSVSHIIFEEPGGKNASSIDSLSLDPTTVDAPLTGNSLPCLADIWLGFLMRANMFDLHYNGISAADTMRAGKPFPAALEITKFTVHIRPATQGGVAWGIGVNDDNATIDQIIKALKKSGASVTTNADGTHTATFDAKNHPPCEPPNTGGPPPLPSTDLLSSAIWASALAAAGVGLLGAKKLARA